MYYAKGWSTGRILYPLTVLCALDLHDCCLLHRVYMVKWNNLSRRLTDCTLSWKDSNSRYIISMLLL